MIRQVVFLMFIVGVVIADKYGHDDHHHGHNDHYDHHDNIDYKFHYDVKDDKHYNYQTRTEKKDGKNIYGTYTLVEPDGKKRIVKYKADDYGFHADVDYEGGYKHDNYGHGYKHDDHHGYKHDDHHGYKHDDHHGYKHDDYGHGHHY